MKKIITFMICTLFLLAVGLCSCSSDDENATPTTRLDKGVLTDWQLEIADYFVSNNCGFQLWRLLYKGQYYYWFYNGIFSTYLYLRQPRESRKYRILRRWLEGLGNDIRLRP